MGEDISKLKKSIANIKKVLKKEVKPLTRTEPIKKPKLTIKRLCYEVYKRTLAIFIMFHIVLYTF